jgi:hypothetical protein
MGAGIWVRAEAGKLNRRPPAHESNDGRRAIPKLAPRGRYRFTARRNRLKWAHKHLFWLSQTIWRGAPYHVARYRE